MRAPGWAVLRLTLSAPVLYGACSKLVLFVGPENREAFRRARHATRSDAPLRAVWRDAIVHWPS